MGATAGPECAWWSRPRALLPKAECSAVALASKENAGAAWLPRREVVRSGGSRSAAVGATYFRLGESVLLDWVIEYAFLLIWMSRLVPPPALLADM